MTDPDQTDATLTPEQDAVRALLAQQRHGEPMPSAVVARLEATLGDLLAERSAAPVVDLAARRRRRTGTALLAAAAVVVAGVGLGQVLGGLDGEADLATSAETTQGDASLAEENTEAGAGASSDDGADQAQPEAGAEKQARTQSPGAALLADAGRLRSERLRADLRALRAGTGLAPAGQAATDTSGVCGPADLAVAPLDPIAPAAGGTMGITLDGEPAVAVFAPVSDGRQRVEVYLCTDASPTRTVVLRAP